MRQNSLGPHRLLLETLEERVVLAPVPVVTLAQPRPAMIGESLDLTVRFDNQASGAPSVGYGPYVDLFLDTTGADGVFPGSAEPTDFDGLGPITASFLGVPLTVTPVTLGPGASFLHPFATDASGSPLAGTAPAGFAQGDTLYVIELPFGSFVNDQPVADLNITTSLHPEADLNSNLHVAAIGGFRFGADSLNNPTVDAPIRGAVAAQLVAPTVVSLSKTYNGPENETATGPNFPRRYTISADVAAGQTVTDLRLIDYLPNNLSFLSIVATTPGGAIIEQQPTIGAPQNSPNNDLVVRFPAITGTSGASDAAVTFEFFVSEFDADGNRIISATTGNDVISVNDGRLTGDWVPNDPSDPPATVNIVNQTDGADNHTLDDKSIAIQKHVRVLTDIGAPGPTPGDTMLYTLNFQVSDYFSFGDLQIEDIVSDGQRLAGSPSGPFPGPFTLSVTDRNGTVTGNFVASTVSGASNLFVDVSQIGNDTNPATDGSTRLVFDVSQAMIDLGAADGILQGGRASSPNQGPATGTITFPTVIQQDFSDTYPSGGPTIDQGDQLENHVTITGTVRDNADPLSILGRESDASAASFQILTGDLLKTVYAINGTLGTNNPAVDPGTGQPIGPSFPSNVGVRPGDVVTYRLRYSLPTGDVEQFRITDFLPLPVFDVTSFSTSLNTTISAAAPVVGTAKYGPDHTFSRIPSSGPTTRDPLVSVRSNANSLTFDFGTFDDPPPENPTLVDLLISVRVSDAPMADGLFLTNQSQGFHGTTNTQPVLDEAIIQIVLTEPELEVRKGIVSTSNSAGVFAGAIAPAGISFEALGLNTPATSFSGGVIQSTNLGSTIDANLSNVDAGDLVKFAIVVENIGSSSAGAFDVRIRDSLPSGFVIPSSATGLNLEVFDGTGAPIGFTTLGSGLFDPTGGIELNDPGPTVATLAGSPPLTINGGALDGYHSTSGRNLGIVTFDLQVADNVQPGQTAGLLNTATVFNYAGWESGQDHTNPTDLVDTAQVQIALPRQTKTIDATSEAHTGVVSGVERVAVGEIVRYRLVTELPEGQSPSFQFVDRLPSGLQFLDDGTATVAFVASAADGVTSSLAGLSGASVAGTSSYNPVFVLPPNRIANGPFSNGRDPVFDLGTLTNRERDADPEYVIVEFNALALNSVAASNDAGDNRNNSYQVRVGGQIVGAASRAVRVSIVEPSISLTKTAAPTTIDAGDVVTYTVTYTNATGATRSTAYDVRLVDTLPGDLTLSPGSVTITPTGGAAGVANLTAGNTVDVTLDQMPPGSRVTLVYQATVGSGIAPAEVLNNSARVRYTSLPGPNGTTVNPTGSATPGSPGTDMGERNGSGVGTNDHTATQTAPVTGRLPTVNKTRIQTSINGANNSDAQATIGEFVTYDVVVNVPEGHVDQARLVDSLAPGLAFVDVESVTSSSALAIQNPIGTGATPSHVAVTNNGGTVSFNFGNIVNSNTDNTVAETIVIRYRAVVLNVGGNQSSPVTDLINSAQFFWTGNSLAPVSAAAVRVIEPDLQIQKSANPVQVDAQDLVTFTVVIGHTAASNTNAHDIHFHDVLPAGLSYVGSSLTHVGGVAPASLSESSGVLDAIWNDLPLGQTSTLQFQATVNALEQIGQSLTNTAVVDWTSLPGSINSDLSVHNTNSRERTGTGGVNNYTTSDSATVAIDVALNKSLVATSEVTTTATNTAIGEIVRYHLWVQLPEGSAPRFRIIDALPPGLQFLDDGTTRFAFVSNGTGIQSSTLGSGSVETGASGALSPSFVLPASAISGGPFDGGTDPIFSFGDLVNADNDADAEFVVVEFNAVVLNVASNVVGRNRVNTFRAFVAGAQVGPASNAVQIQVVEPSISDVDKTVVAPVGGGVDATQTVTYAVTYSNWAGAGASTAFDVRLSDLLPAGLTSLSNVHVYRNGSEIFVGFTDNSTAARLDLLVDRVAPGDQIEVRYDAVVTSSTLPATTINNTATLDYSSLPGDGGASPNPTGSIPGNPGTITGERNGSGGVNTYVDSDGAAVTTFSHTISGFVYRDQNNNGVFDEGAGAAIAGVTVSLTGTDHLGNPVNLATTTGPSGAYSFAGLRPGAYTIRESQPAGLLNGRDTPGTPPLGAVNASPFDDTIGVLTIPVGAASLVSTNNNFGELDPATVSGFVYVDSNNDGLRNAEGGIGGVVVALSGTDDQGNAVSLSTTTNANGAYRFIDLRPGTYQVIETQPPNYVDGFETRGNTVPLAGSAGGPDTITGISVASGQTAADNNFGEVPPSQISGRVFTDIGNDGYMTGNDAGIPGITLLLTGTDVNGQGVSRSTTSAADGTYQFVGLMAGTYSVSEPTQPPGHFDGQETRNNSLLPGSIGSDSIGSIVLGIGATALENNFAEVPVVDPQGYVYMDANRNGVRDPGEVGIPGVPVTLSGFGPDVFGNTVTPQTAFTDSNGFYQFANLAPGHFTITETQPVGFQDGQEQNGTPPAATVNNDQFVDIDLTNNLLGGDYNFGELSPTSSLSGSVYIDQNNNGRRDSGEIGLAGVVVTVVDQNDPSMQATVITDLNGNYRFVKMFPGTYRLLETQPVNFVDGRETAGSAGGSVGNDVISNIVLGVSEAASGYLFGELGVDPGQVTKREFLASIRPGIDFTGRPGSGLAAVGVPLADPSGFVYVDLDQNGLRDPGEPGIPNVRIDLLGSTSDGQTIRQHLTTDAYGFYQFAFLPPGTYELKEVQPIGYLDGVETIGSHGGIAGDDEFHQIVLKAGEIGVNYNFGERVPALADGDVDGDGVVRASDVDAFCSAVRAKNPWFDLTQDQALDNDDLLAFLQDVLGTSPGDANLDGQFNSSDLLLVFIAGTYEDATPGNATWSTGDWDCDTESSSSDLVWALRHSDYLANSLPWVAAAVNERQPWGMLADLAFANEQDADSDRNRLNRAPLA